MGGDESYLDSLLSAFNTELVEEKSKMSKHTEDDRNHGSGHALVFDAQNTILKNDPPAKADFMSDDFDIDGFGSLDFDSDDFKLDDFEIEGFDDDIEIEGFDDDEPSSEHNIEETAEQADVPVPEEPVLEEPSLNDSTVSEPVIEAPNLDDMVSEEPVLDETSDEIPVIEEPMEEEVPVIDDVALAEESTDIPAPSLDEVSDEATVQADESDVLDILNQVDEAGTEGLEGDEMSLDELNLDELGLDGLNLDELGGEDASAPSVSDDAGGIEVPSTDELGLDELSLDDIGADAVPVMPDAEPAGGASDDLEGINLDELSFDELGLGEINLGDDGEISMDGIGEIGEDFDLSDLNVGGSDDNPLAGEISFDDEEPSEDNKKGKKKKKQKKPKKTKEERKAAGISLFHKLFDNVQEPKKEGNELLPDDVVEEEKKKKKEKPKKVELTPEEKKALEAEKEEAKKAKAAAKAAKKEAKAAEKERKKEAAIMEAEEAAASAGKINKYGALIVVAFVALIGVVIVLGSNSTSYTLSIKGAAREFGLKHYNEAYYKIRGLEIKPADMELHDKIMTVMYVNKQLNSYNNYAAMDMHPEAIDSLLKGLQRYDKYLALAKELGIESDLDYVRNQILGELGRVYGIDEREAIHLTENADDADYSRKLYLVASAVKKEEEEEYVP